MEIQCPRCHASNRSIARFCARCGLALEVGVDGTCRAGRIRHPQPLTPAGDYRLCVAAAYLYYRSESALGGEALLGTEGVSVFMFNGGYPLRDVVLELHGEGKDGKALLAMEQTLAELPRGEEVSFEIPSYELAAPLARLVITLASAEFASAE
jgi:hypothetical protein